MSTPTLVIEEGRHWSRIGPPEYKNGRAIFKFKCHICNRIFKRHRNAPSHCIQCIAQRTHSKGQATLDNSVVKNAITPTQPLSDSQTTTVTQETIDIEPYPVPIDKRKKAIVE